MRERERKKSYTASRGVGWDKKRASRRGKNVEVLIWGVFYIYLLLILIRAICVTLYKRWF